MGLNNRLNSIKKKKSDTNSNVNLVNIIIKLNSGKFDKLVFNLKEKELEKYIEQYGEKFFLEFIEGLSYLNHEVTNLIYNKRFADISKECE